MSDFWNTIWNLINTKVGIAIITAIVSVVATMICQVIYLKFKRRASFEKVIGNKITSALDAVRDIELSARSIEIYDLDELLKENGDNIDFFEQQAYYPTIMSSPENFGEFLDNIIKARGACEKYLNYNVAAYLLYMERYCMNIMAYAGKNSISLDWLGTVTLFDFQTWQKQVDKELVKLINKPQYRVYSQSCCEWEKAKNKFAIELWEDSILCKLMNNDDSPEIKAAKAILFNDPEAEKLVDKLS